ncbi:hypothetical protein A2U01_0070279, partial [Trifolium medium]|nr:hypothetical protein [Trifolium medium]
WSVMSSPITREEPVTIATLSCSGYEVALAV